MRQPLSLSRRTLIGALAALSVMPATLRADPAPQVQGDVVVFAAASLKNALDAVAAEWQKTKEGGKAVISYAASSALAKQIEQGAPAQVFISADLEWMDYLAKGNHINKGSRFELLGNRLVLIAPKASATPVEIKPGFDLAGLLKDGRLAVGQVESVPAGKYAKAALEKLGVWPTVADKLAQAENVRAALALVARGEAAAGIVYATDAAAEPAVTVVGTFPQDSHPPIVYPVALLVSGYEEKPKSFLAFLGSPEARAIFEKQGFTVLVK